MTGIEIEEIKAARYEVNHIGNNLNQIARKINSGELHHFNRIDGNYLKRIIETIGNLESAIANQLL
ncbi:MAG: plasmid mobilization relaxosome protein MobC [Methylococcales bacterium]